MRLSPRRRNGSGLDDWQPRLWLVIVGLALLGLYVIAFIVRNDDRVTIDFLLFSANTSLIWLVILSVTIGIVAGVLLSQLYRRRARPSGSPAEPTVAEP